MPITVHVKGQELQFPDGTPPDVIDAAVQRDFFSGVSDKAAKNKAAIAASTPEAKTFGGGLYDETLGGLMDSLGNLSGQNGAGTALLELAKKMPAGMALQLLYGAGKGALHEGGAALHAGGQAIDALKQGDISGAAGHGLEAWGHGAAATVPIVGPAAANAAESINRGDVGYGLGQATGLLGQVVAPEVAARGVGAVVGRAPAIAEKAVSGYKGVFGRGGQALADKVVPELLDRRVTTTDPRTDLAPRAEDAATAANARVDAAIAQMNPIDAQAVRQSISDAMNKQFQPVGNPVAVGPQRMAPKGPDSQLIADKMGAHLDNTIEPNVSGGVIAPENARTLRKNFDVRPAKTGMYSGNATPPADAAAQAGVGDALRKEINKDPLAAAANKDENFWLNVKKISEHAPQSKKIGEIITENANRAAAGFFGKMVGVPFVGPLYETWAVMKTLRDIPKTAAWKTTTADMRWQFAKSLHRNDWAAAARVGSGIVSGNEVAQNNQ